MHKNIFHFSSLKIIILVCGVLVLGLTVGYSILSEQLNINNKVTIRALKDVRIIDISKIESINGGYEVNDVRYNVNSINSNVGLPRLDSKVSYNVTITNNGTAPMKISNIYQSINDNYDIVYSISGLEIDDIISPNSSVNFKVTYQYGNSIISLPVLDKQESNSLIEFGFEEYIDSSVDYALNGLQLNLSGEDSPSNNEWMDRSNPGKNFNISSVKYNSESKYYDFSNTGFISYNKPLIPETSDFTLEVSLKTPSYVSSSEDQAIVAQISDSQSSSGRFKFNFTFKDGVCSLLVFVNETSNGTNTFHYFSNNINLGSNYLLQVVRTNGKLMLYIDGVLATSDSFSSNNKISQTVFKMGKWNNNQYYKGGIYSVRLYDRALSSDEIFNNYQKDNEIYLHKYVDTSSLFGYVKTTSLTTFGDGLYNSNDSYIYKGRNVNNYVKFFNDDHMYRIVKFESDGTMKLVDISTKVNKPFDESGNRNPLDSPYCTASKSTNNTSGNLYLGCNYMCKEEDKVSNNSSSLNYLVNEYYPSLTSTIQNKIVSHSYACGSAKSNDSYLNIISSINSKKCYEKVGLLTIGDLIDSLVITPDKISDNYKGISYVFDLSNNDDAIWLSNGSSDNSYDVWSILGGAVTRRRASRYNQSNISYYIQPTIYVSSSVGFSGIGTIDNPYIIND